MRIGNRWTWLTVALLALLPATWLAVRVLRPSAVPTVVLVDPEVEEGSGMGEAHRYALGNLLQDHLELAAGVPLFRLPFAPGAEALAKGRNREAMVLRLRAARRGNQLQWTLRWAWFEELRAGGGYREISAPALPPKESLRWLFQHLSLPVDGNLLRSLLPDDPGAFWEYLEASALGNDGARQGEAIRRLGALCGREPGCAVFRAQLGILLYFRMNGGGPDSLQDQAQAEAQLKESLRLLPHYPRAVSFTSRLYTDIGSVREALELLQEARRHRPRDLTVLGSIWYPARYAGLVPLAVAASQRVQDLNPMGNHPPRLAFHLLYAGRWDEFQASLWEWPGDPRNATCRFHRGVLALLRGDRERALALLRETEQMGTGHRQYRALARVYRAILEGKREEALAGLKGLQRDRAGLRVPDGEVTLTIAGAHMLLGEAGQAMELARLAFSQGFGCTQWFEQDPLLEPLRTQPQWPWLLQHLRERQALFESRFTAGSFGL